MSQTETFTCPFCKTEFEAEIHVKGSCPSCKETYEWDVDCDTPEDAVYSIDWDKYYKR